MLATEHMKRGFADDGAMVVRELFTPEQLERAPIPVQPVRPIAMTDGEAAMKEVIPARMIHQDCQEST